MMDRSTYIGLYGEPTIDNLGVYLDQAASRGTRPLRRIRRSVAAQGFKVQGARNSTATSATFSMRLSP